MRWPRIFRAAGVLGGLADGYRTRTAGPLAPGGLRSPRWAGSAAKSAAT